MKRLTPAVVLLAVLLGCGSRPIHPGTANKFDSSVYDALIAAHSVIESTKTELGNNTFPANVQPQVKDALNKLIAVYNETDILYCNPPAGAGPTDSCAAGSYHAQAIAGQATPATDAAMKAKVDSMNSAVKALATSKGTK